LFGEKVEKDLKVNFFKNKFLKVTSNIIGVFQVQKIIEERKKCEEKEKKRKELKGDQHIKGCESQILKSKSIVNLESIVEDYKIFLFSKFSIKKKCL
jgi:hypothetical protein